MNNTLVYDPIAAGELEGEVYQWLTDNREIVDNRQQARAIIVEYLLQQRGLTQHKMFDGLPY